MFLSVDKAADFLGVSTETIRSMARRQAIPAAKVGRLWRFHEGDLSNFVRNQYADNAAVHGSTPGGLAAGVDAPLVARG